jgi:hypothetical protein
MLADLDHAVEATQVNHINPWEGCTNKPATERTRKTKLDRKPSRQEDATGPIPCRPQQFQSDFGILDISSEDVGIAKEKAWRNMSALVRSLCLSIRQKDQKKRVNYQNVNTFCGLGQTSRPHESPESFIPINNAFAQFWPAP